MGGGVRKRLQASAGSRGKARRQDPSERGAAAEATSLAQVTRWLELAGTQAQIEALGQYGIVAHRPFGVTVGRLKAYAKQIGRDHDLALALWDTGRYEARMLASFIDEPARVSSEQMRRWAADFDNWAIVDTACFHLFDRTPHAWSMVETWSTAQPEFTKRGAFALIWALSHHDKQAADAPFTAALAMIEREAHDERDYVRKAIDMALRAIGKRNSRLHQQAIATAERLATRDEPAARWIGKHARRELASDKVRRRLRH